jgi:hypothetical protein
MLGLLFIIRYQSRWKIIIKKVAEQEEMAKKPNVFYFTEEQIRLPFKV